MEHPWLANVDWKKMKKQNYVVSLSFPFLFPLLVLSSKRPTHSKPCCRGPTSWMACETGIYLPCRGLTHISPFLCSRRAYLKANLPWRIGTNTSDPSKNSSPVSPLHLCLPRHSNWTTTISITTGPVHAARSSSSQVSLQEAPFTQVSAMYPSFTRRHSTLICHHSHKPNRILRHSSRVSIHDHVLAQSIYRDRLLSSVLHLQCLWFVS